MAPVGTSASKGEVIGSEMIKQKFVRDASDASTSLPEDEQATDAVLGVLSAVVLGGDLRDSWSWHQRSGGFGKKGTRGKKGTSDKGVPQRSPEKRPRANAAPSSAVTGNAADRMRAWQWR
jgi:hypothetical protein